MTVDTTSDASRSPSRIGFMGSDLQSQSFYTGIGWADGSENDDVDDGEWEFASALLVPSQSSGSDESDIADEISDFQTTFTVNLPSYKPTLSSSSVQATAEPIVLYGGDCTLAELPIHDSPSFPDEDPYFPAIVIPDHGHSRSALLHLKEFWNSRYDEYARMEATLSPPCVYGGIVELNRSRDSVRTLLMSKLANTSPHVPADLDTPRPRLPPPNVTAPIYPRTGDLASLRDTRSAALDRIFCHYPLYSINKILFLHDMLRRSTGVDPSSSPHSATSHSGESDASEDPDETFVDIPLAGDTHVQNEVTLVLSDSTFSVPTDQTDNPWLTKHGAQATKPARSWELDWMVRWRVLLDTSKDDVISLQHSFFASAAVTESAFLAALHPERPKAAKFFFAEDDDEFAGLNSDEDDDDYGLLLARPAYGITADSLSKEFLRAFDLKSGP